MSAKDCKALNFLLSLLYKSAALAGLVTIVTTLDVTLSVLVIIGAFALYYVSREIVSRLCPYQKAEEHRQITRTIHHSETQLSAIDRSHMDREMNQYSGNVTPFRKAPSSARSAEETSTAKVRIN